jgi:hypothetical protein
MLFCNQSIEIDTISLQRKHPAVVEVKLWFQTWFIPGFTNPVLHHWQCRMIAPGIIFITASITIAYKESAANFAIEHLMTHFII